MRTLADTGVATASTAGPARAGGGALPLPSGRLTAPVHCHLNPAINVLGEVAANLSVVSGTPERLATGEATSINWRVTGSIDPSCRTPLYLVVSFPGPCALRG